MQPLRLEYAVVDKRMVAGSEVGGAEACSLTGSGAQPPTSRKWLICGGHFLADSFSGPFASFRVARTKNFTLSRRDAYVSSRLKLKPNGCKTTEKCLVFE